jgi:serine/threonine-protein kinase
MSDAAERWRRLEEVCQAALARPAPEREAFLAELCGTDEELRRQAESLLERDARAVEFLATPLGELAAHAMSDSPGSAVLSDQTPELVGRRVGAYEIRARVGAGGMGEVYRAYDHVLGRDVAIKVLPPAFSTDAERLARFEREARLLASLSHPHIGAIYGLETSGDVRALILEYIQGETLEAKIARGPIAVNQSLTLAVQIAEALDHAHRKGVMHRDLKPANIMLTHSGVKLLDFGLAKWGGPRGYVSSSSVTGHVDQGADRSLTEEGMILGTPHYMAPEQLEGQHVDARADVFAFGALLFEMLTGQKAFSGGSAAAVMAAVLNAEPPRLSALQPSASPALQRLIDKCLAKSADERWQTAKDLADELKWIGAGLDSPGPFSAGRWRDNEVPHAPRWRTRLKVAALVITVGALALYGGWRLARSRQPAPAGVVTRFPIQAAPGAAIDAFDLAADGSAIVYLRRSREDGIRLYLRRLDQLRDSPIPGTEGASSPLFSPDGQWVAFFAGNRLLKVNVHTDSGPILVSESVEPWLNGAAWLPDGTIIFSRPNHALHRVSSDGGEAIPVTELKETPREFDHHSPVLLPGGQVVLFTLHAHDGRFHVVAETLATGSRKLLLESAFDARYVDSGHLVFARDGRILAVPFDVNRLEVTGRPVTLVESVMGRPRDGNGGYRLATNGTLAFLHAPSLTGRTLTWVDRTGVETPLPITSRAFSTPSVSPDGSRLAFAVADGDRRDIFTYDIAGGTLTRLTRAGDNSAPVWARDGHSVTYAASSSSSSTSGSTSDAKQLIRHPLDTSGEPEPLTSGERSLAPSSAARDLLVYADGGTAPTGIGIFAIKDGERRPERWVDGPAEEYEASLSPDGRWLAFTSTESGLEVHVAAISNAGVRHQGIVGAGREPKWSRDGRELMYRSFAQMFAVPMDTTRGTPAGRARVLFDANAYVSGAGDLAGFDYDLAPDGRFLMVKRSPEEQVSSLHVALNWIDELKRRVPRNQ